MGKLAALVTETRDQDFGIVAGSASYLLAAMLVGKMAPLFVHDRIIFCVPETTVDLFVFKFELVIFPAQVARAE